MFYSMLDMIVEDQHMSLTFRACKAMQCVLLRSYQVSYVWVVCIVYDRVNTSTVAAT